MVRPAVGKLGSRRAHEACDTAQHTIAGVALLPATGAKQIATFVLYARHLHAPQDAAANSTTWTAAAAGIAGFERHFADVIRRIAREVLKAIVSARARLANTTSGRANTRASAGARLACAGYAAAGTFETRIADAAHGHGTAPNIPTRGVEHTHVRIVARELRIHIEARSYLRAVIHHLARRDSSV